MTSRFARNSDGSPTGAGGSGFVIAFVGSEATGKSTLLEEVETWLSPGHDVRRVHAGKPPATVLTAIPHVLLPILRTIFPEQRSTHVERRSSRPPGDARTAPLLFAVRCVMLAYERRRLLTRAAGWAAGGAIVLTDRYPSTRGGAADSPQLEHLLDPGVDRTRRLLATLEIRSYRRIPSPDLVIHLSAPLEVTLARNTARGKIEPEEHVRFRHSLNAQAAFDGAIVRRIDTNRDLASVVADVRAAVSAAVGSASEEVPG